MGASSWTLDALSKPQMILICSHSRHLRYRNGEVAYVFPEDVVTERSQAYSRRHWQAPLRAQERDLLTVWLDNHSPP